MLPCPDLDEAIAFYGSLGFRRTYRQVRPNPYAVMAREDMTIHLAGIEGFDPATSVGNVIVVVPDADALYVSFVEGLRRDLGRLPSAGIPRILRPRRKQGTTTGFTVVDPGGNWLRFYGAADVGPDAGEDEDEDRSTGLSRVLEVAARHGDARGDDEQALAVLERGLQRHPRASVVETVRVLLYQAELLVRIGDGEQARATFARATQLPLTTAEADAVAEDVAHAREVVAAVGS